MTAIPADASLEGSQSKLSQRLFAAGVGVLIALGVVARVVIWVSPWGLPDADEATGGLMARHLLSGDFSVFLWGQAYGGTLEAVLAAPVVAIFGDSWIGLRMIPILLCGLTALVVWRVGLRTMSRYGAITAAAVYWFFPSYLLWKSIHFHIFYASGMLLAALTLLLVLRLREQPSRRDVALLGLVVGIGLWQSFQLVTVIPVALAWLLLRRRDILRLTPLAVPGLLAGLVPVLISNVQHSWWSLDIGQIGIQSTYLSRIGTFYTDTLPMSLDVRAPCTRQWFLFPGAGIALYAALLAGFVLLAWRSWRTTRELLIAVAAVFPFIYAINQLTGQFANPGYVLVLTPVLALLLCTAVSRPLAGLWVMGGVSLLVAGSFIDVHSKLVAGQPVTGCMVKVAYLPRDFGPLEHALDQHGIERLYADYWIAYRLDYETGERIIAADGRANALRVSAAGGVIPKPNDDSLRPRHPQYEAIVGRVARAAWVIDKDYDTANLDAWAFAQAGYRSEDVGRFTIYWAGQASQGVGTP